MPLFDHKVDGMIRHTIPSEKRRSYEEIKTFFSRDFNLIGHDASRIYCRYTDFCS